MTAQVEDALDEMRPGLTGLQIDSSVFRPADFIDSAVHNLRTAVIVGVALFALVLLALLFAWRTALVCLVAFAVSLTAAALVLLATGATFNALIFAGLAAAVGVVVDDAVLDGEAIRRRLGERVETGKRGLAPAVVRRAAAEARGPMGYATAIILLTTVPVFLVQGVSGAFFEPVVWAYVVAVVASLLVALTVTPALSVFLFPKMPGPGRASPLLRRARARYDSALSRIAARPVPVLIGAGVVALAGLAMIPALHGPVIPAFHDRDLLVHFDGPAGTSQPEMSRIVARVARDLRAVPGVQDVGGHLGRAVTGDQVVDVNSSELWVKLDSKADYDDTRAAVVRTVDGYPGFKRSVMTYERQRIRDIGAIDDRQADAEATRSADLDVLTGTSRQPLVEEEHPGPVDEPDGDIEAALHPAGVRPDDPAGIGGQPDRVEQVADAIAEIRAAHAEEACLELQVLAAGERLVDAGALGDDADRAPDPRSMRADVVAGDERAARIRARERRQNLDRRGLARAVRAEQSEDAAGRDAQADVVEGTDLAAVRLAQMVGFDGLHVRDSLRLL